jgi:hypothetical protein
MNPPADIHTAVVVGRVGRSRHCTEVVGRSEVGSPHTVGVVYPFGQRSLSEVVPHAIPLTVLRSPAAADILAVVACTRQHAHEWQKRKWQKRTRQHLRGAVILAVLRLLLSAVVPLAWVV